MQLANDACGDYFSEPAFAMGVSQLCELTNSSDSCISTEFEIQTLEADEPICPNVRASKILRPYRFSFCYLI
jgi:hypothetical protein